MQELIDELKLIEAYPMSPLVLRMATDLLEKEKEQIKKAYEDGKNLIQYKDEWGEIYYNQTYNQKNNDKCGCFVSDGTTSMNCKFCGKHYSQHI